MAWINVKDQLPTDGQEVYYFSPILGLWRGKYVCRPSAQSIYWDEDGNPVYERLPVHVQQMISPHVFFCKSGSCDTDEVTHWQPYDAARVEAGWCPLPPNHGISDERMSEYREWREEVANAS